jgi:hypothetical protein
VDLWREFGSIFGLARGFGNEELPSFLRHHLHKYE